MNATVEFVLTGMLVPAAVSFAVYWVSCRLLSAETSARYAAALGFAAGFCAGYALLVAITGPPGERRFDWALLLPKRHWHWIFYLTPAAALVGSIASSSGLLRPERWLLAAMLAIATAPLVVPTWADLQPRRLYCAPLLAAYVLVLAALLEPLAARRPSRTLLFYLMLSAACVAMLIAAAVSLTFSGLAAAAAAALGGVLVADCCAAGGSGGAHGLSLAYAVCVGGWAFVGAIEPRPPLWALMLAPLAPLALWSCVAGPLSRLRGWWGIAVGVALVLVVLGIAGAMVMTSGGG
jgi:hypothetical protein